MKNQALAALLLLLTFTLGHAQHKPARTGEHETTEVEVEFETTREDHAWEREIESLLVHKRDESKIGWFAKIGIGNREQSAYAGPLFQPLKGLRLGAGIGMTRETADEDEEPSRTTAIVGGLILAQKGKVHFRQVLEVGQKFWYQSRLMIELREGLEVGPLFEKEHGIGATAEIRLTGHLALEGAVLRGNATTAKIGFGVRF